MKKYIILIGILWGIACQSFADKQSSWSTAGFYELKNSGRKVYNMNVAWRFRKGDIPDAWQTNYPDSLWEVVNIPHGLEYLPEKASGCVNYQGIAWYRKHFSFPAELKGKKIFLYFEGIMGKSKIWVNGRLLSEHFGGYLPVAVDISEIVKPGEDNIVAVCTDNSNDPAYPPGKPQETLDFSYFGGIYRDCYLITHNHIFITDPNYENETAGGGIFVGYDRVSEQSAEVLLKLQVKNVTEKTFQGKINYILEDTVGRKVAGLTQKLHIKAGQTAERNGKMEVRVPSLWSPEHPNLYWLIVTVKDAAGKTIDGYKQRIGIRSIEFRGKDGFWLNGKPYPFPLIGANRHQDFAVVGNALPNSMHWRDAKKLREAGLKVIRNAHYPQDPAFMDACDELGLFVIVNTPGWQFWNNDPVFGERVYADIRNMVRRDRNHPSVWLWEPILNETWYPADFAEKVRHIVEEEYPYPGCYCACDETARGKEYYAIRYTHPATGDAGWESRESNDTVTYFTREWGDNVDDWNSHNSPSRVDRSWGEKPMLIQANHYASPSYKYTCYETLYQTSRQHAGGCLWHSFDHQRGYHPDPFYGGLMDAFRQPKYAYYMFMAQREKTEPMIYIAHEMTPFSPSDVTVYSNCDEVRLTFCKDGETRIYHKEKRNTGMPSPIVIFRDIYDFMHDKELSRAGKQEEVYLLAEGLIDGKVVAREIKRPARRPAKIIMWVDDNGKKLTADGSDFVTVVAAIADQQGNIKRLNKDEIRFTVKGPASIVGEESGFVNPKPIEWGTAPVLIRSGLQPGKITVHAEVLLKGSQMPVAGEVTFESVAPGFQMLYDPQEAEKLNTRNMEKNGDKTTNFELKKEIQKLQQELNSIRLKEVERQQGEFEK
ncbi:glycoside hydrolase family 2 protein [Culturomica massiliensis]|uniref:glycoside hydrolase family 2 protein n=1 Tax=Culturomica massiliensis TaxID=1841857 RepID=UPI0026659920|nr:glycoside hydrolase family 2 TIM barrel-domain containing protein [Culturomica massiliensis]